MFTGIVEEIGTVLRVEPLGNGVEIDVAAARVLAGTAVGDSISVDGVCQTVTVVEPDRFRVQAVATTLSRTTFGSFRPGRRVNLERALAAGQRMGGHLVQGHVDAVGQIRSVSPQAELVLIDFLLPAEVAEVTVLHGSIAVNGVSLTVNAIPEPEVCQIAIIPHTWSHTALRDLQHGDGINLEGDMIGRYVRHLLGAPGAADLRRAWGY